MTMAIESRAVSPFEDGNVQDVIAEELPLRAYVAIRPPDPEAVAGFVPPEQFESGAQLHVAAVDSPDEASTVVEDVLFNMDPDDAVAFLCADAPSWWATLELLGYVRETGPLE